ncbi:hypothetical protein [Brachybacterium sacelli]
MPFATGWAPPAHYLWCHGKLWRLSVPVSTVGANVLKDRIGRRQS